MPVHPGNKYHLNELHREIDYLDRKIAHFQSFERFESGQDRATAVRKLETKRETLAKAALALAAQGIEYDAKHLPRSFKRQPLTSSVPATAGERDS